LCGPTEINHATLVFVSLYKEVVLIRFTFCLSFLTLIFIQSISYATQTTKFSFNHWHVDFSKSHWDLSTKICNVAQGGYAGDLDFQFRLVKDGRFYVIGHNFTTPPKYPGHCMEYTGFSIPVNTTRVPHARYEVWIDLAERMDNKWVTVDKIKLDKDWIYP
jgi:hypothetical protein